MLFTDEFVESLKDTPIKGALEICRIAFDQIHSSGPWSESSHEWLIEVYVLLTELIESKLLVFDNSPQCNLIGNIDHDCKHISKFVEYVSQECELQTSQLKQQAFQFELQSKRSKFKATLGTSFCYEFSQGDMDRVQLLVNQIRDLISSSEDLETDHQRRLLMRLEKLQSELHKRMPDLDRFWG